MLCAGSSCRSTAGRYRVIAGTDLASASAEAPVVTCVRAAHLRRRAIVPGDRVSMVGDTSGDDGSSARIVAVDARTTVLRRSSDDTDPTERVVVANADTLVAVTATADPEPSWGFLDRTIVGGVRRGDPPAAGRDQDGSGPGRWRSVTRFADVDVEIVECGFDEAGLPRTDALLPHLADRQSVLLGHSGVGKSTLINRLVPGADRATGSVNENTGSGRHTSSSTWALPLPQGGWVVDTPGVRSFGLAHIDPDAVVSAYEELTPATADCPRGCTHAEGAVGCALDAWVASGAAGPAGTRRLRSLRRLLGNLT